MGTSSPGVKLSMNEEMVFDDVIKGLNCQSLTPYVK
jgi:hypothetical protein